MPAMPAMSAAEAALAAFLAKLDIATHTHRHPPLFSVADAKALRGDLPGGHAKTLLLKDKAGIYVLLAAQEDRRLDLKALADIAATKRLSFASPERLGQELGVRPGAVTPFALVNRRDRTGRPAMRVLIDAALLACDPLNFHPLHNAATTAISPDDLLRFIAACGYQPGIVDFERGRVDGAL